MAPPKHRVRRHTNPFNVPNITTPIDWKEFFGTTAPLEVEIGPAGGAFLLESARQNPSRHIIGLEIRVQWVKLLQERITKAQHKNAAVFYANANQALPVLFSPNSLHRMYIFHPDPWIKKRHLKRRLVNQSFVKTLENILIPGGEVFAQSDVKELAQEMLSTLDAQENFTNQAGRGAFLTENPLQISTETERYWREQGEPVYYLHFRKNPTM